MSGFEVVAGVIAAFFVLGIGVGVTMMIALSALRYRRVVSGDGRPAPWQRRPGRPGQGAGWQEPSWPDAYDDGQPRWPSG